MSVLLTSACGHAAQIQLERPTSASSSISTERCRRFAAELFDEVARTVSSLATIYPSRRSTPAQGGAGYVGFPPFALTLIVTGHEFGKI